MKSLIATMATTLLPLLALAQEDNPCCFRLESVGKITDIVQENSLGFLRLLSNFYETGFCLDLTKGLLTDHVTNRPCHLTDGYLQEMQCSSDVEGSTEFTLAEGPDDLGGGLFLLWEEQPVFFACPPGEEGSNSGYRLYGYTEMDVNCIPVYLKAIDAGDACYVGLKDIVFKKVNVGDKGDNKTDNDSDKPTDPATAAPEADKIKGNVIARRGPMKKVLATRKPSSSSTSDTIKSNPSPTEPPPCKIDPNGPYLSPEAVSIHSPEGALLPSSARTGSVLISPKHLARFSFRVPPDFGGEETRLCAVQFRFPFCGDLPKEYPCFEWTGLEHDVLAEAGMHWSWGGENDAEDDEARDGGEVENQQYAESDPGEGEEDGEDLEPTWWQLEDPFQLVSSEVNTTVGVFGCKWEEGTEGDEGWMGRFIVKSVNGFSLSYLQAGGDSGFEDGVGAFVVPCVPEE